MIPDVFSLLNVAAITAYVGTNPPRIYRAGQAPQNVAAPYVTWAVIDGVPENALADTPAIDSFSIQVDLWSDNAGTGADGVDALANVVRDQIETAHHITAISNDGIDELTQRYRLTITFTYWLSR